MSLPPPVAVLPILALKLCSLPEGVHTGSLVYAQRGGKLRGRRVIDYHVSAVSHTLRILAQRLLHRHVGRRLLFFAVAVTSLGSIGQGIEPVDQIPRSTVRQHQVLKLLLASDTLRESCSGRAEL